MNRQNAQQSNIPVTVERQLYRLIPGEEEMSFTLQPVTSNEIDSDALYLDEITLTSEQDAVLRYGQMECPSRREPTLSARHGAFQSINPTPPKQGQLLEKARNEMGRPMVPVKELTGTVTFRHLLRSQRAIRSASCSLFFLPAQQSVAGSECARMQVK
ncbi:hypothetical protein BANRA_04618 [Escherichia coli]|nr:hypothetical protein BANRA_04618 [Escherichia coli]